MSFSRNRNVTDAVKLGPGIRSRVICPDIIEPSNAISATKPMGKSAAVLTRLPKHIQVKLIVPGNHRVIGTSGR
jgi:hypothetical protein